MADRDAEDVVKSGVTTVVGGTVNVVKSNPVPTGAATGGVIGFFVGGPVGAAVGAAIGSVAGWLHSKT